MKREFNFYIVLVMHLIVFSNIWSRENDTEQKKKTAIKLKNYKILFKQDKKFNQTSRGSASGAKKTGMLLFFDSFRIFRVQNLNI